MGLLLLLFSCATGPETEPADEPSTDVTGDADEGVARPADGAGAAEDADTPGEQEATVSDADDADDADVGDTSPQPLTLLLINPSDPTRLTRSPFILSARPSEGTLVRIHVELLSGPVAPDVRDRPFEIVDLADLPLDERSYDIPVTDDAMLLRVPAGFVDGAVYRLRVRGTLEDGRATEWVEVEPSLDLGIDPPRPTAPRSTIDSSPEIHVDTDRPVEVIVDDERSFVAESGGTIESTFELSAGRYLLRTRILSSMGYISAPSPAVDMRVLAAAQPEANWPVGGETTLSSRVGLQWSAVTGGVEYQARYRETAESSWLQLDPTIETFARIPEAFEPGQELEWQVRVRNEAGTWFSWSEPERLVVGSYEGAYARVIAGGQRATVTRGYANGSRDEQPVREIELTHAFEMSIVPLSNAELARIVGYATERDLVSVDATGVWAPGDDERVALVGLGEMDYGEQFGLRVADGELEPVPGYEDHPAIGVTWTGAVRIANLLSYVEGRAPVYDEEGGVPDAGANGYRLPTEAEWEYAARGTTERLFPWGGSLSGRVANYYRSFDPFEDVDEPFTGNGGPTNPVGFFDGSVRGGFQTASDASPFGVRDMVGNVWEWTYDRYDPNYFSQSPDVDPWGPEATGFDVENEAIVLAVALDPNLRVVRGTAWNTRSPDVRLTNRGRYSEAGRSYSIGVRLVRAPLP